MLSVLDTVGIVHVSGDAEGPAAAALTLCNVKCEAVQDVVCATYINKIFLRSRISFHKILFNHKKDATMNPNLHSMYIYWDYEPPDTFARQIRGMHNSILHKK